MRIQRITAVVTRCVVDQIDRTITAVASVVAAAFGLQQMHLGMLPCGSPPPAGKPMPYGLMPYGLECCPFRSGTSRSGWPASAGA